MRYRFHICFLLITILSVLYVTGFSQPRVQKIRVACIGDSVTKGFGLDNPESESYPAQLQRLLGIAYEVENFGVNGSTLLSKGHHPYILTDEYRHALAFKPQLVIIHLGLNDTDPRDWPNYRDDFVADYLKLIQSFQSPGGQMPKVFVCRMTPIFNGHPRFKSGTRDWFWQIEQKIEQVAKIAHAGLIDLHAPLYPYPNLFIDAVHPDKSGAATISKTVYSHITGDFGGLKLAPVFMDHMVLQQKVKIHVWGKANADETIEATFNHRAEKCMVNEAGEWTLNFDPAPAGGNYTLKVTAGNGQTVVINDILVGELWVCAGQSNMEFPLKDGANASSDIFRAQNPNIRLLNMKGIVRPDDTRWDSLSLDKINKLEFLQGKWESCNRANAAEFSAIGYYFVKKLNEKLNIPVGIIQVTVGGAPVEAFIDRKTLESDPILVDVLCKWKQNNLIVDWCRERAALNISLSKNELQRHPFEPAYIYESGIHMLKGLAISGVIWYQGESNAQNAEHYEHAFPLVVRSWRKTFNDEKLPFYFAQLSAINRPSWPYFRDIQRKLSHVVPNTGMVVTSDLGDSLNVHPKRKREVGERFANLALANVYGQNPVYCTPEVSEIIQTGDLVRIKFDHAVQLQTSDGRPIRELEIAGADGIYEEVNGVTQANELFIATNKPIQKVRYGWKPFSRGNLVNEAGLPASTFETNIQ